MTYKYFALEGSRLSDAQAQEVGEALDALQTELQHPPSREDVVRAAQESDSMMHQFFTWSDAEAARLRRLDEAGTLLRAIGIEVVERDDPDTREIIRARYPIFYEGGNGQRGYADLPTVQSDTRYILQVQQRALRDLNAFTRRYDRMMRIPVFREIMSPVLEAAKAAAKMIGTETEGGSSNRE